MSVYFQNINNAVQTLSNGLKLTLNHLWDARDSREPIGVEDTGYFDKDRGIATLQYPFESLPVPDTGRYRLHNEMEDCIVCDKCAKICPVDCIEIEPIRAIEEIGQTSDGTPKRIHAAKFDIDMAKCCFCGLCTTVCPTECLTMTKVYDFSEFDIRDHNYAFGIMSQEEIDLKREELRVWEEKKIAAKDADAQKDENKADTASSKPVFRPKVKPAAAGGERKDTEARPKPVFRPKVMKPKLKGSGSAEEESAKPKPVYKPRPMIPKKPRKGDDAD